MKHAFRKAFLSSVLTVASLNAAHADVITVGTRSAGTAWENSFPFGYTTVQNVRYQQIYGAAAFGAIDEPIYINSLKFFADAQSCGPWGCYEQAQSVSEGHYVVRLSTTSKTVSGLSTTSMNDNLGADVATFFSGNLKDTLTISGEAFRYDRTMGNLLLEIVMSNVVFNGSYYWASSATNDQMARMYSANGGNTPIIQGAPAARSIGLVTEFAYMRESDIPTDVPEPASIALMGAGLGLVGYMRRRKTA